MEYFLPAMIFFTIFMIGVMIFASVANEKYDNGKQPKDSRVTKTKIIAVNGITETSHKGMYSRAILGGMLAGESGALLGALSATKQEHVDNQFTFLVYYSGGEVKTENVKQSSGRFKFLVSKLKA